MKVTGIGSISSILNGRQTTLEMSPIAISSKLSPYEKAGRDLYLYWKDQLKNERDEAIIRKLSLTGYLREYAPDKYIRLQELFVAINKS